MKRYRCHKVVEAAKVVDVVIADEGFNHLMKLDSGETVEWPQGKVNGDAIGGYYIRYEDGYTSWSPAHSFENGYAEIEP